MIPNSLQGINVMAISETHCRQDVPRERFEFPGFSVWHADRGGLDKVNIQLQINSARTARPEETRRKAEINLIITLSLIR